MINPHCCFAEKIQHTRKHLASKDTVLSKVKYQNAPTCYHIRNQYYTESVNEAEPGFFISKLQRRVKNLIGTLYFLHIPYALVSCVVF